MARIPLDASMKSRIAPTGCVEANLRVTIPDFLQGNMSRSLLKRAKVLERPFRSAKAIFLSTIQGYGWYRPTAFPCLVC